MSDKTSVITYRVIDVQVDLFTGKCHVYCRSKGCERRVFVLAAIFEITLGTEFDIYNNIVQEMVDKYEGVEIVNVRKTTTYYRGLKTLFTLRCDDSRRMKRVLDDVKYKHNRKLFICNGYSTIEDTTLMYYDLYGANYVDHKDNKLYRAKDEHHFIYTPRIGSFDFEMLSLDVTNILEGLFEL
jgi:hypothetical protein